jgi:hypothetical protein
MPNGTNIAKAWLFFKKDLPQSQNLAIVKLENKGLHL